MSKTKVLSFDEENFRRSSEEIAILVKSRSEFLDSLIRMGEEPYEIECEVTRLASLIATGVAKKIQGLPYPLIYASANGLLQYIYLYRWSWRSSLAKMPGTWLADFLQVLTDDGKEPWPAAPLTITQFYSILFHYVHECGVAVKLKVLLRVLEQCERKLETSATLETLECEPPMQARVGSPSLRTVH